MTGWLWGSWDPGLEPVRAGQPEGSSVRGRWARARGLPGSEQCSPGGAGRRAELLTRRTAGQCSARLLPPRWPRDRPSGRERGKPSGLSLGCLQRTWPWTGTFSQPPFVEGLLHARPPWVREAAGGGGSACPSAQSRATHAALRCVDGRTRPPTAASPVEGRLQPTHVGVTVPLGP